MIRFSQRTSPVLLRRTLGTASDCTEAYPGRVEILLLGIQFQQYTRWEAFRKMMTPIGSCPAKGHRVD